MKNINLKQKHSFVYILWQTLKRFLKPILAVVGIVILFAGLTYLNIHIFKATDVESLLTVMAKEVFVLILAICIGSCIYWILMIPVAKLKSMKRMTLLPLTKEEMIANDITTLWEYMAFINDLLLVETWNKTTVRAFVPDSVAEDIRKSIIEVFNVDEEFANQLHNEESLPALNSETEEEITIATFGPYFGFTWMGTCKEINAKYEKE